MVPPSFNRLFIAHLQRTWGPSLQIDQIDSIVADSTLPADIVHTHSSKDDDEPVFVEDGWVVAAGSGDFELLHPSLPLEGVDLCFAKRVAAMSSYDHCHILVDSGGMAFPGWWLPTFEVMGGGDDGVFDILMEGLSDWLLDDFSYLGIQGGQSLFLIIVDIQYLLVFEGLLHVLAELHLPNAVHLRFYTLELLLILPQHHFQTSLLLFLTNPCFLPWRFMPEKRGCLSLHRKIDFVEVVEAIVDSLEEALPLVRWVGSTIVYGHGLVRGEYNFIEWYSK